jgi:hypothetical protein
MDAKRLALPALAGRPGSVVEGLAIAGKPGNAVERLYA